MLIGVITHPSFLPYLLSLKHQSDIMFIQKANVLTGQLIGFQSAFSVESADYKIICEPAGTGAEAGAHFATGPVAPLSLQNGAY